MTRHVAPGPPPEGDRLRVALDATPLLGRPTGVGAFCRGALGALAARPGLEVSAFAVSWRRRHRLAEVLPPGVAWHQRAMPARPLHQAWRHTSGPPLEWFVGAADVVHGTNFVVPPARAARVVTVHDLTSVLYPELCQPASLAFPELVRRALAEGALVHTPSAWVAGEVVELLGADPGQVRSVHSGIPALPDPARGAAPDLPPGTDRFVLAVGTAEPRKDLPGLVAAFDRLAAERPGLALVLAGPSGWGEEALDAAVARTGFAARVVRTGWVDDATLARLLAGAAVLAYPSRYEGFGFPPLQAMAVGVPVVATTAGSLPEVLGDAARLVPAGDPDALAGALAEVLDDEGRRAELVSRGLARAAGFTWEATAAGLDALYRDARSRR